MSHRRSLSANEGTMTTYLPQYTFEEPHASKGNNNKEQTRMRAGRFSRHKRSLSATSSNGSLAGQSTAEESTDSGGLTEIMNFLNDLEEQDKLEQKMKKSQKLERKLSSSDRSMLSAASSLAYSEGMSTYLHSEDNTPTNSEGGATLDGSLLVGTKLLGNLLGEPPTSPMSVGESTADGSLLAGTTLLLDGKQKELVSPINNQKSEDGDFPNDLEVARSPPSKSERPGLELPTLSSNRDAKGVSTMAGTELLISQQQDISAKKSPDQGDHDYNEAVASSPSNPTTPPRTRSVASNTTSNSSGSTPVPTEPATPDRARSQGSNAAIRSNESSPRRNKKKGTRKSAAEAVELDEETYFLDVEQTTLSRFFCGVNLGDFKMMCGMGR